MFCPEYAEDEGELGSAIEQALVRGGAHSASGDMKSRWPELRASQKLKILADLPPAQEYMFLLRDAAGKTNAYRDWLKHWLSHLNDSDGTTSRQEYLAAASGFISRDGQSHMSLIPRRIGIVRQGTSILVHRLNQRGHVSAWKRSEELAGKLVDTANALYPDRLAEHVHQLDLRRVMFNVRLMQTLVEHGSSVTLLRSAGFEHKAARSLLNKHQTSELRDIDTVNDALRFIPVRPLGADLAAEYIGIRAEPRILLRAVTRARVRAVIKTPECRQLLAACDMFFRVMGIVNPYRVSISRANHVESHERKGAQRLLASLGLTGCIDAKILVQNALTCRDLYDSILSVAKPY